MPKKSKPGRSKGLIALVLVLIGTNIATLYYFVVYRPSVPAEDVPMSIAGLTGSPEEYIGKVLTVEGYYVVAAGVMSMLIENPLLFLNNSLGPRNHVYVTGDVPTTMEQYVGLRCKVKGRVEWANESQGLVGVRYQAHAAVDTKVLHQGPFNDAVVNPLHLVEKPPFQFLPRGEKYAVLFSGGISPSNAHLRYWNDLAYMYIILKIFGYPPENIYVVYKDGVAYNSYMPVDYPATHASMDAVFDELSSKMGFRDTLFFFTTNHGGHGGIYTWGPMDSSSMLTHTEVADWLDSITCRHMIIVMEQCYSGRFIEYLSAENRVILTACSGNEGSWAADTEGNWDEFVYHFMCAVIGLAINNNGPAVDADYDNDGHVSMREAFVYAALADSRAETPLYDDDGDGVAADIEYVFFHAGGFGDTIFL